MTLTRFGSLSQVIRLDSLLHFAVLTPEILLLPVWPLPRSLATTSGISFDFSSSGYLDVSVPRVPFARLCIHRTIHDSSSWGFPHSEICGLSLICSYPQLIAACHVLHRLLMPRHPLCALVRLNFYRISIRYSRFSRLNCCVSRFTVTLAFSKIVYYFYPTFFGKT